MIDYFALALTHALLALAAWRLLSRADLDHEEPLDSPAPPPPAEPPARTKPRLQVRPRA